jgi:hypothetical protein
LAEKVQNRQTQNGFFGKSAGKRRAKLSKNAGSAPGALECVPFSDACFWHPVCAKINRNMSYCRRMEIEMPRKILIVDDEPLIVKGLRYSLLQDGYEIDTAGDGEQALQQIRDGIQYHLVTKSSSSLNHKPSSRCSVVTK